MSILRPEPDRPDSWTRFKENIAHLIIQSLVLLRMRDDLVKNEIGLNRLLFLCILKANRRRDLPLPALDAKNSPHITNEREEKGYGKGCETGAIVGYVQDMEFDEILSEINFHLATNAPSIPILTMPTEGWKNQDVSRLSHGFQRVYIPFDFFLQHFWVDMRDSQYLPSKVISISNESNGGSSEEAIKEDHKRGQKEHTEQKQFQLELPLENSFEPTTIYIEADLKKRKTDL